MRRCPQLLSLSSPSSMAFHPSEAVDIQIDYWLDGVERKYSIKKSSTRCVQITSNGLLSEGSNPLLSMTVASMEKKQKIMRIGKKQKEVEIRRDVIENISRLVGTSKSQSNSMKGEAREGGLEMIAFGFPFPFGSLFF